jgi:putative DNA primase/helicase
MKHDGTIDIATGHSRKSRKWKNQTWKWSEMVTRLSQEHKTMETYQEYMSANKEDQSEIKDIGGYVGGYLRNGKRSPKNVVHRQLMTLDIDFAHLQFWEDYLLMFDNAAVIHATHKHHEKSPRFRLVLPLSRECTSDEYVAVSRRMAGDLGIELFDNTTFEPNRLMYWPSSPKDIPYYFEFQDGPFLDVDQTLARYIDWKDTSLWPTSTAYGDTIKGTLDKQQDPETKKGVIGVFCRAYPISEAIAQFLQEDYVDAENDRYTYTKGSTAAGMIVYGDKFAFSHHGTDPSGGKLCNSFDLVRIHKFGHLDDDGGNGSKSLKAMQAFMLDDKNVKGLLASENLASAKYDFKDLEEGEEPDIDAMDWMRELDIDAKGQNKSSAVNLNLIFENDPRLSKVFRHNEFDGKRYLFGNLPWRRTSPPELMRNVDYAGIRNYIETIYGVTGNLKIDDCLALQFEENSYHPIREYIRASEWDGVARIDHLFIDYFGAQDTIYSKQASRKMLVAAVSRIMRPGCKYDSVVTLVGPEGTGKSTFAANLAGPWFSDTFMTVHGKEALEQIQGAWIIEMAELSGLRKAEVESVKHFITKQVDMFRPAYAKVSEVFPRQCIFIGTTNKSDFLKSTTGNRRFIPIDVNQELVTKSVWDDMDDATVEQFWAEAFIYYKKGETLYMENEAKKLAEAEQSKHAETDDRMGLVENFLDQLLPKDWESRGLMERRMFIEAQGEGVDPKQFTCVAEVWCECFGRDKEQMDRYKTRDINEMLKIMPGWEQVNSTKNFRLYGKQKYFRRV